MIHRLMMEGCGHADTPGGKLVGNDRLRSAFHDDNGKPLFIDLKGHTITKFTTPELKRFGEVVGIVDNSHYIPEKDYGNYHQIISLKYDNSRYFTWSIEGIKKILKDIFNTTVEEIEIHTDGYYNAFCTDGYNYGDREEC